MNQIEEIKLENLIYEIRGRYVILDSDLAKLYQCKNGTKVINQAVKRHINRFPEDFCFQINEIEYRSILRSQIVTLELNKENIVSIFHMYLLKKVLLCWLQFLEHLLQKI